MAMDTRTKRASALAVRLPWMISLGLPLADGAIDQGDRQATVQMYSGILASGAPAVTTTRRRLLPLLGMGR
jgi:hypothetical protein